VRDKRGEAEGSGGFERHNANGPGLAFSPGHFCIVESAAFGCTVCLRGNEKLGEGGARGRARISPCEASGAAGLSHGWVDLCTDLMVACGSGSRRCGRARLMQPGGVDVRARGSGACCCEGVWRGMNLRGCLRSQQPLHRIRGKEGERDGCREGWREGRRVGS
jgi:hypothetical protein